MVSLWLNIEFVFFFFLKDHCLQVFQQAHLALIDAFAVTHKKKLPLMFTAWKPYFFFLSLSFVF